MLPAGSGGMQVPWLVPLVGVVVLVSTRWFPSQVPIRYTPCDSQLWYVGGQEFEDFDNYTGVQTGQYIVPNYVHFLRMGPKLKKFGFIESLCVLAALKHQNPDKIYFHTDHEQFIGKYWELLMNIKRFSDIVEFIPTKLPTEIFGQKFSRSYHLFHAGDILRIRLLLKYGGIFLDNDSYLVQSLDKYRKFEMALGWDHDNYLGTQVLVAHKDARFLKLWQDSYRQYYPTLWNYNAGEQPTKNILWARPELIHGVKLLFGTHLLVQEVYYMLWPQWRKQFAIHLLSRHYNRPKELFDGERYLPDVFDEENVLLYNNTIRELALDVYPY